MLAQILIQTPIYVWGILALILVTGAMQLRHRTINRTQLVLTPIAMLALSAYTVVSNFGIAAETLPAWIAGIAIAHLLNTSLIAMPRGATFDSAKNAFAIPGSAMPLLIMLAIFSANYVLGLTRAIAPTLLATPSFKIALSVTMGFCSGLLLSRARCVMHAAGA